MGALSAGQLDQAQACVLPGSVPAAVTTGLLVQQKQSAAYAPTGQVDDQVFNYQGAGKTVAVSVTREADGRFWVTNIEVR